MPNGDEHIYSEVEKHYRLLQNDCFSVLTETFKSSHATLHSKNHSFVADFGIWVKTLEQRTEGTLLKAALREYQYGLLSVVQGQYRQAFMALRLFLELALGAVHFSANELELRIWIKNQRDIKWASIAEDEAGIFSKKFVSAFFPELCDDAAQYRSLAVKVYRECSEYVHGNAHTHITIPDKIVFVDKLFKEWQEKAENVNLVVTFALCARYLCGLSEIEKEALSQPILDILGHVTTVRVFLGGTTEES